MGTSLFITSVGVNPANSGVEVRVQCYERGVLQRLAARPTLAIAVGSLHASAPQMWFDAFGSSIPGATEGLAREDRWSLFASAANSRRGPTVLAEGSIDSLAERLETLIEERPMTVTLFAESALRKFDSQRFESLLQQILGAARMRATVEATPEAPEIRNRERLLTIRRKLLEQVPALGSEDIAALRGSMSPNASQVALDLRKSGGAFGVKCGKEYRYPKFQFDARGNVRPEVPRIRAALGDDPYGWDTLQWFVEPNETLAGRAPIEVFDESPARVEQAAQHAHWSARD